MKEKELIALFESYNSKFIDWVGQCHDCKKDIKVTAERTETIIDDKVKIDIKIDGGAVYSVDDKYYIKCPNCYNKDSLLLTSTVWFTRYIKRYDYKIKFIKH